jgi:predicted nucleic acid-binding protein
VIFVDTNVFMYAVGGPHPLKGPAREFFAESNRDRTPLCTSAEVLQELVHAYLRVERLRTLDEAMSLVVRSGVEVWPLEDEDVTLARQLHEQYPALGARDLCHLASCRRRGVGEIKTFDQGLRAVAGAMSPRRGT